MSVYHFYHEAMQALGVSCNLLLPTTIPADAVLTRDTSLRTELMQRLTGIEPLSVKEALAHE